MILKRVDELKGDERLAKAVMTWNYQIILPEGTVLKKEYIDKILGFGILHVYVEDEDTGLAKLTSLQSKIRKTARKKVEEILERHTYRNNEELKELSKTADNIISDIVEEKEIVSRMLEIEERSADIYEHCINVCAFSVITALKMGIAGENIHDIGVGCLLHEIGLRYITVDYNGRDLEDFTKLEKAEYKKHPVYGFSALKEEEWIRELSKVIVLYHHEKMNGTGYPLKTEDVPLECRIVNVCDTFDEMICGIGYEQQKVHHAVEYLEKNKGTMFDEKAVDVFLGFIAKYPAGTYVLTNEGETAVVVGQNAGYRDRPIIRMIRDKDGKAVKKEVLKNLMEKPTIEIEKVLDEGGRYD